MAPYIDRGRSVTCPYRTGAEGAVVANAPGEAFVEWALFDGKTRLEWMPYGHLYVNSPQIKNRRICADTLLDERGFARP